MTLKQNLDIHDDIKQKLEHSTWYY